MISIRRAKFSITGLQDMIIYIRNHSELKPKQMQMVELGCYVGDSTREFARNFQCVHCIDPWENGYDDNDTSSYKHPMKLVEEQFDLLLTEYDNIYKHKMKSDEAVNLFRDHSLDLVYVDALHTYAGVKNDIMNWLDKVKNNGWIAGHDYGSKHHPGVKKAVLEFFKPDMIFKDTSWIKRI